MTTQKLTALQTKLNKRMSKRKKPTNNFIVITPKRTQADIDIISYVCECKEKCNKRTGNKRKVFRNHI